MSRVVEPRGWGTLGTQSDSGFDEIIGCNRPTASSSELRIIHGKGLFVPNTLHLDFFITPEK